MASTYSNLKIQLMATGENTTSWGDVTNLNLGTAIEEAIVGSADVTFASNNVTLALADTNASQTARNVRLRCTGTTGGSTRNLVVPSIEKPYIIKNDCADPILVKTAAGTGITVPAGKTMWVYVDGANVVDAVTHLSGLTLNAPLPVAQGGTGANTAVDARTSLGLGSLATASSVDLTSQVTGVLPITNGGTGANTAAAVRTNLGLGTVATQNSDSVSITGGAISGVTLSTTGTPTAPTANPGTNNTQIATTAFVQAALQAFYPVGSVYINAAVTTNPATLLGFGTWVEIGAGRVLVGQDTGDTSFNTLAKTGGSKNAIAVSHTHTASATVNDPGHVHQQRRDDSYGAQGTSFGNPDANWGTVEYGPTSPSTTGISVGVTVNSAGSSGVNANLQPYIVVKMWQRTA